jgi:hypothetical protein
MDADMDDIQAGQMKFNLEVSFLSSKGLSFMGFP